MTRPAAANGDREPTRPPVDAFVERATSWRGEMEKLCSAVLASGLDEALKWGKPCFTRTGRYEFTGIDSAAKSNIIRSLGAGRVLDRAEVGYAAVDCGEGESWDRIVDLVARGRCAGRAAPCVRTASI